MSVSKGRGLNGVEGQVRVRVRVRVKVRVRVMVRVRVRVRLRLRLLAQTTRLVQGSVRQCRVV